MRLLRRTGKAGRVMNVDIRLSVDFWQHPKTYRLEKRIGLKGVRSLQILWCWCAKNRPDGNLAGFSVDEIEFAADWRGKKGAFVEACAGNWLDETEDGWCLHEWSEYNPYQAQACDREMARKEKARKAANARWQKSSADDAGNAQAYANDNPGTCSGNAQAYANHDASICSSTCSGNAPGNAQAMPTRTCTSTIKALNTHPLPLASEGDAGMDAKQPHVSPGSRADGTNPRALGNNPRATGTNPRRQGTNPRAVGPDPASEDPPDREPDMEFMQLREAWDLEMRPEGPLAGFKAYLALKKARAWPGLAAIRGDIQKRKQAGVWNPGYEPGLEKYLNERVWLAGLPKPRAAPGRARTFAEIEEEQRQRRRQRAMEYDLRKEREEREAENA